MSEAQSSFFLFTAHSELRTFEKVFNLELNLVAKSLVFGQGSLVFCFVHANAHPGITNVLSFGN